MQCLRDARGALESASEWLCIRGARASIFRKGMRRTWASRTARFVRAGSSRSMVRSGAALAAGLAVKIDLRSA